ncbi:cation-translocating P-type ATPase [Clostridium fallax]|uniref:Cation-transporting ATPase E n=1 Tax=Clostridium fallax TaxID=1533 RepID=A0A1M4VYG6_9CLOT|nr:cation-translocating P-type ATPase [Clostridium fallax]SHE74051.1 cation-transporting ATPase E [Clostridium fallax]SQB07758.1 cation-transporting ATPase, P-type [Clostridium fallax]
MERNELDNTRNEKILGLTEEQVKERVKKGEINVIPDAPSRTLGQIIRANLFNRFNAINLGLAVAVILAGSPKNALFAFVILINTCIGIFQELKAKATIEKLSILSSSKVTVIRDGKEKEVSIEDVVLNDVIVLETGNQIIADGEVIGDDEFDVDESLLTGESDAVHKKRGDNLLSGSFIIAGRGYFTVTKVGKDTYAAKLSEEAKKFKKVNSELQSSIDKILKYIMWIIVPVSILLIFTQIYFSGKSWQQAALGAVAGIVGMVPEGLVLLTSLTFVAGVIRLSKWNTLVQELPATEILARVDVLCLDKTGTLTEGVLKVVDTIPLNNNNLEDVEIKISNVVKASEGNNSTDKALKDRFKSHNDFEVLEKIPFSSARKWNAVSFKKEGSFYLGAPEMVLKNRYEEIRDLVEDAASKGKRVLVFAHDNSQSLSEKAPEDLEPLAIILIQDTIRKEAAQTLAYFKKQDVNIKIISGDNPITVSAIAKESGVQNADKCIDARTLPEDREQLREILEKNTVFGRVNPHQKKEFVKALQSQGHTVAMTGDGVNDVLALKESDCGIAMATGSDATKAVAQLVLLDSNFSALPEVVAEGRRMINNIERVAVMFLSKTVYSVMLSIIFIFLLMPFPLLPIQLSLIGSIAIGIPSFFLALVPNTGIVKLGFLKRVFVERSIPNGIIMCLSTTTIFVLGITNGLPLGQCRTLAVIVLGGISLVLLFTIAKPFDTFKFLLVVCMFALFSLAFMFGIGRMIFNLENISLFYLLVSGGFIAASLPIANLLKKVVIKISNNLEKKTSAKIEIND